MKIDFDKQNLQKTLLDALKNKNEHPASDAKTTWQDMLVCDEKSVVIVCFGTPNVAGDAFGPLVADSLRDELNAPVFVYGTTDCPITAKNMADKLDFITTVHKGDLIISVDASLGENVGGVAVRRDGVCPAAVRGRKKRFGDIGVLGIVAPPGSDALVNLMSADFDTVERLAAVTAQAIYQVIA